MLHWGWASEEKVITLREGQLPSTNAIISLVDMSGIHCRTEHDLLLVESENYLSVVSGFVNPKQLQGKQNSQIVPKFN